MITAYIAYPDLGTVHESQTAAEVQAVKECRARGISATLSHAIGVTPEWGSEPTLRLEFVAPDYERVRRLVASLLKAWDQTCALVVATGKHADYEDYPVPSLWFADGRPDERLE